MKANQCLLKKMARASVSHELAKKSLLLQILVHILKRRFPKGKLMVSKSNVGYTVQSLTCELAKH
jgi:hypothetical protein